MFDRIYLKENRISETPIDLGKFCETLLFYNKVDLLVDKFSVQQLIKFIDIEQLKVLASKEIINIHFRNSAIGIVQFPISDKIGIGPMVTKSEAFNLEQYVNQTYLELLGDKKQALKKTDDFLGICTPQEYTKGFQEMLESECEDKILLTSQLKTYIKLYLPQLDVTSLKLQIEEKDTTPFGTSIYYYKSNFDFEYLNKQYSDLFPDGVNLDWTSFLLFSNESSGDLNIASQYNAEIYTDIRHYPFIQDRVEKIINELVKSDKEIASFADVVLEDYKPIRESINSGEITFNEFFKIIDKSQDFKIWLKELETDTSLLARYYSAVIRESWIDKKVSKAARFSFFTALGIIGDTLTGGIPVASLVASAADNYLLPKLASGWKPNQFIDNEVKPILIRKIVKP